MIIKGVFNFFLKWNFLVILINFFKIFPCGERKTGEKGGDCPTPFNLKKPLRKYEAGRGGPRGPCSGGHKPFHHHPVLRPWRPPGTGPRGFKPQCKGAPKGAGGKKTPGGGATQRHKGKAGAKTTGAIPKGKTNPRGRGKRGASRRNAGVKKRAAGEALGGGQTPRRKKTKGEGQPGEK